jgi:hypothetical protein
VAQTRDPKRLIDTDVLVDALRGMTDAIDFLASFLSHGLLIPDALIAATALEFNLTLCTKNIRHFQMIPDLELFRPY